MKKRVLTGYRPTGKLHIGHYHGNLMNMLNLQEEYECFFFIADWHALTTTYEDTSSLQSDITDMILDWVAAGLDPQKCIIYKQSDIPEVAELTIYLGMITPLSWLERCPTYKEQLQELKERAITTYGFLGYPVLMTADIIVMRSELVPVGEDQLAHLELAREIARRFNYLYGNYFKEPQALLSEGKRIPGIDGRKMSKSYNNTINLSDPPEVIQKKVRQMITDPQRIRLSDKGHPDICDVFSLHRLYTPARLSEIAERCRGATIGCTDCKDLLARQLIDSLTDFQTRRKELESDLSFVEKIFQEGAKKARPIAQETVQEVRKKMNMRSD